MDTVTARVTVKVVTGETFLSSWSEESPETWEEVRRFLSGMTHLDQFDITTADGTKIFINPAHIVYAYVETK